MKLAFIATAFALSLAWALCFPAHGQPLDIEAQQRIYDQLQFEKRELEQQRADLDAAIAKRGDALTLINVLMSANGMLSRRLQALQPTPTSGPDPVPPESGEPAAGGQ